MISTPNTRIVIPTVSPERDRYAHQTVDQLFEQGFNDIIVSETRKDVPPGFRGQGITARTGIIEALESPCDAILHLEDDVLLSKRLTPHFLQGLVLHGGIITLYVPSRQRFEAVPGSLVLKETWVTRVRNQTHWFGCQGVVIPRNVAEHLARIPEEQMNAIDFELRDYMDYYNQPLYAVVPNVVQHLAPRSIGNQAAGRHTSATFM